MKISYNWLKEYIAFKFNSKDLAERLTMAGLEVKSVEQKDGDYIFEAEITSNRPDWLSIYGIAREIQVITGSKLKSINPVRESHQLKSVVFSNGVKVKLPKESSSLKPLIIVEDKKGCLRYAGRIIAGIEVGLSPKWLIERIESAGIKPVNNVVDITNFCLMESGQPLHAFDYDKLDGGRIVVRRAKKGEEIITIDGVRHRLDETILVIADAVRPVAVAGVIGGKDTEITFSTKRILLESAYFDPPTIRMAAKRLGISTESSYRFERGVDLDGVLSASNRATALICDLAKAKAISKAVDAGTRTARQAKITLRISKVNKILGMEVPASKCVAILKGLGLKVKQKRKDSLEILVPSFRADLKEGIDLIEEIARIYGYDKVPETLTKISVCGKGNRKSAERVIEDMVRETLAGMGLNEVISHALISKGNVVNKIMNIGEDKLPTVQNPLSSESEALRPSALCGIMDVLAHNINRKIPDMRIFELGKSYFCKDDDGAPSEKDVLAIALCGIKAKDWRNKTALDIFDLKGVIEALFEKLGISEYEFGDSDSPLLAPSASSTIKIGGRDIGILGKLSKAVLDGYDVKIPIFISELDLKPICMRAKLEYKFAGLPRYPSMIRDISLIADDKVSNGEITSLIKRVCGDPAISVKPFDLYRGEQIPKDSKSILYSVEYRASDRTLTNEEVNSLDKKVREALAECLKAKIR